MIDLVKKRAEIDQILCDWCIGKSSVCEDIQYQNECGVKHSLLSALAAAGVAIVDKQYISQEAEQRLRQNGIEPHYRVYPLIEAKP